MDPSSSSLPSQSSSSSNPHENEMNTVKSVCRRLPDNDTPDDLKGNLDLQRLSAPASLPPEGTLPVLGSSLRTNSNADYPQNPEWNKEVPLEKVKDKRLCAMEGCLRYKRAKSGGYCLTHLRSSQGLLQSDHKKTCNNEHQAAGTVKREMMGTEMVRVEQPTEGAALTHSNSTRIHQEQVTEVILNEKYTDDIMDWNASIDLDPTGREESPFNVQPLAVAQALASPLPPLTTSAASTALPSTYSPERKLPPLSQQCKFDGCTRFKQTNCNGYCLTHLEVGQRLKDRILQKTGLGEEGHGAYHDEEDTENLIIKVRVRVNAKICQGHCYGRLGKEEYGSIVASRPSPLDAVFTGKKKTKRNILSTGMKEENGNNAEEDYGTPPMESLPPALPTMDSSSSMSNAELLVLKEENSSTLNEHSLMEYQQQNLLHDPVFAPFHSDLSSRGMDESSDHPPNSTPPKIENEDIDAHLVVKNRSTSEPVDVGRDEGRNALPTRFLFTHIPPGIEISDEQPKNEKGRSICKVIGCTKLDQTNNDGFCRAHFNLLVLEELRENIANTGSTLDTWTCKCGQLVSSTQKRCGLCHCWKGGVRDPFTMTSKVGVEDFERTGKNRLKCWTCDCGNKIDMRKSRCGKCHHWRGGKRVGGWKLGMKQLYEDESDTIDRAVDWVCCGETIQAKQTRCGKCHGWRGGKRKVRWSYDGSICGEKHIPVDPSISWDCPKCKNINQGDKKRCSECSTWRFSRKKVKAKRSATESDDEEEDTVSIGNWKCNSCSFDNFMAETKCIICQTSRPNWQKFVNISDGDAGSDIPIYQTNSLYSANIDNLLNSGVAMGEDVNNFSYYPNNIGHASNVMSGDSTSFAIDTDSLTHHIDGKLEYNAHSQLCNELITDSSTYKSFNNVNNSGTLNFEGIMNGNKNSDQSTVHTVMSMNDTSHMDYINSNEEITGTSSSIMPGSSLHNDSFLSNTLNDSGSNYGNSTSINGFSTFSSYLMNLTKGSNHNSTSTFDHAWTSNSDPNENSVQEDIVQV